MVHSQPPSLSPEEAIGIGGQPHSFPEIQPTPRVPSPKHGSFLDPFGRLGSIRGLGASVRLRECAGRRSGGAGIWCWWPSATMLAPWATRPAACSRTWAPQRKQRDLCGARVIGFSEDPTVLSKTPKGIPWEPASAVQLKEGGPPKGDSSINNSARAIFVGCSSTGLNWVYSF